MQRRRAVKLEMTYFKPYVNAKTTEAVRNVTFIHVMLVETIGVANLGRMVIHLPCVCNGDAVNQFGGLTVVGKM